jgi:hypothetical protein
MVERKTVSIRRLANGRTEAVKFERFIRNKEVTIARLIHTEQTRVREVVRGRHVLAIQDTTEINYQKHAGRVHSLGTVGNGKDAGFFMHPLLVLDANTGSCLGSAAIEIWNRLEGASDKYPKLPIEEKESYRWLSTAEKGKKILSEASCVTFIGDRENDIYEFFDRIPNEKTHIITRVRVDRCLKIGEKLYEHLDKQKEAGKIIVTIPREIRRGREERKAVLLIKYCEIEIKKPENCSDKIAPKTIKLRVVEAKEINCPSGQEPIHWRLFTTHQITTPEDAQQIVFWYRKRWNVEQIFRTIKKQGLDIESSQIESGDNLMKLAVIGLCAAIQIMELVLARNGTTEQKTEEVFTIDERLFLAIILPTLEGKTAKQKNPYLKENLSWASWIIARLGGWQGYTSSEGPPGPIVMGRGLRRFYAMYDGWKLSKDVCAQ